MLKARDIETRPGNHASGFGQNKARIRLRLGYGSFWSSSDLCLYRVPRVSRFNHNTYPDATYIYRYYFRLNNGDVTQKVAQSASCLNDKVFSRTLNVVRKAIADDGKPNKSVAMTYNTLTRSYTIGMVAKVVAWMDEAEKALVLKEVLPAKYEVNSPLVKCAIFFWVCKILKV